MTAYLLSVISGVESAANRLSINPYDIKVREVFTKRTQLLMKAMQLLMSVFSNDFSEDDFLPQLKDIGKLRYNICACDRYCLLCYFIIAIVLST